MTKIELDEIIKFIFEEEGKTNKLVKESGNRNNFDRGYILGKWASWALIKRKIIHILEAQE